MGSEKRNEALLKKQIKKEKRTMGAGVTDATNKTLQIAQAEQKVANRQTQTGRREQDPVHNPGGFVRVQQLTDQLTNLMVEHKSLEAAKATTEDVVASIKDATELLRKAKNDLLAADGQNAAVAATTAKAVQTSVTAYNLLMTSGQTRTGANVWEAGRAIKSAAVFGNEIPFVLPDASRNAFDWTAIDTTWNAAVTAAKAATITTGANVFAALAGALPGGAVPILSKLKAVVTAMNAPNGAEGGTNAMMAKYSAAEARAFVDLLVGLYNATKGWVSSTGATSVSGKALIKRVVGVPGSGGVCEIVKGGANAGNTGVLSAAVYSHGGGFVLDDPFGTTKADVLPFALAIDKVYMQFLGRATPPDASLAASGLGAQAAAVANAGTDQTHMPKDATIQAVAISFAGLLDDVDFVATATGVVAPPVVVPPFTAAGGAVLSGAALKAALLPLTQQIDKLQNSTVACAQMAVFLDQLATSVTSAAKTVQEGLAQIEQIEPLEAVRAEGEATQRVDMARGALISLLSQQTKAGESAQEARRILAR
ncbi:MAG: hypothetical protein LBJ38_03560 [Oscillospiraceae bacterium]|nr:hypothetical protein [Oscillospiraceae bacterium]